MSKGIQNLIKVLVFIVSLVLIVEGQKHIGIPGLCVMMVGLAGLLSLMYLYNKQYQ